MEIGIEAGLGQTALRAVHPRDKRFPDTPPQISQVRITDHQRLEAEKAKIGLGRFT